MRTQQRTRPGRKRPEPVEEMEVEPLEFSRPIRLLAYAYLFLVPFDVNLVVAGRSASFWLALALIGAMALRVMDPKSGRPVALNSRILVPVGVVLLVTWASYFWSISPSRTVGAAGVLTMSAVTWLAVALAIHQTLLQAFRALALGTTVLSFIVLTADIDSAGRADTTADSNDVAVLLAVAAAILIAGLSRRELSWRPRLLYLALLMLHLAALLATGSRTGVLSVGAAVAALALYGLFRVRFGLLLGLVGIGALVAVAMVAFDIQIPDRVMGVGVALETGHLSTREDIWAAARTGIPSVLGIGFGAAPAFMLVELGIPRVVHSVYLGLALEVGVVGVLAWSWMIWRLVTGIPRTPWVRELALASVVLAVMASTLTLETRRPLWMVLTFLAAASIVVQRDVVPRRRGDRARTAQRRPTRVGRHLRAGVQ